MRFHRSFRILAQLAAVLLVGAASCAQPGATADAGTGQTLLGMPLWAGPWEDHH